VRIRKRVQLGPSRWDRVKKWWDKHGTITLLWGIVALAAFVLVLLVVQGYIRGPGPPPPE
jgi:hypothetical protein